MSTATMVERKRLLDHLFFAVHQGNAQVVAAWLDEGGGVDLRFAEQDSATLLMVAISGEQEAIVQMLLQRSANVNLQNSFGLTALMCAVAKGRITIVQVLLDAKADASLQSKNGYTALVCAEKHPVIAQLLRQHAKGLVTEAEGRAAACSAAHASAAHAAAASEAAGAALLAEEAATKKGKGKKKKAKAPPSTAAPQPTDAASSASAPKPAAAEAGLPADVLRAAADKGDAQVVAAWLDEGGGVDTGCVELVSLTLLMVATAGGHEALVRMLLQRGASVNLEGPAGITALMYAACNGHATIAQTLLDAKADASVQTEVGDTPLMLAEHNTHTETVQLLRQHAKRMTAEAKRRAR